MMSKNADYIKRETITGVVPMLKGDRQYSFWDLFFYPIEKISAVQEDLV